MLEATKHQAPQKEVLQKYKLILSIKSWKQMKSRMHR